MFNQSWTLSFLLHSSTAHLLLPPPRYPPYGRTSSMFKLTVALPHTFVKRLPLIFWKKMQSLMKISQEMTSPTRKKPPAPFKTYSCSLTRTQRSSLASSPQRTAQLWPNFLSPTHGHAQCWTWAKGGTDGGHWVHGEHSWQAVGGVEGVGGEGVNNFHFRRP